MTVLFRGTCGRIFILSLAVLGLVDLGTARAGMPPAGLYENSSSAPLLGMIHSAQKMLDIEIYTMGDLRVQNAILAAQKAGVRVRIIQEPTPVGDSCDIFASSANATNGPDAVDCSALRDFRMKVLSAGGIYVPFSHALCGPATLQCVEHGKIIIADGRVALLSTGNFDATNLCDKAQNPSRCNRDYSYVVYYSRDVQLLGQIFERDLAAVPYDLAGMIARSGTTDLMVSPLSLPPLIQFLRSAKKSIAIQEQYLKDPQMNAELIAAARRGVHVYLNVASACAFCSAKLHAEGACPRPNDIRQWTSTYQAFENAGAKIRVFTRRNMVGGLPGYLHAKAILVDGAEAWVGSVNGSTQSIGSNREYGIFFDNPRDVGTLLHYMQNDFTNPGGETWQQSLECVNDL